MLGGRYRTRCNTLLAFALATVGKVDDAMNAADTISEPRMLDPVFWPILASAYAQCVEYEPSFGPLPPNNKSVGQTERSFWCSTDQQWRNLHDASLDANPGILETVLPGPQTSTIAKSLMIAAAAVKLDIFRLFSYDP